MNLQQQEKSRLHDKLTIARKIQNYNSDFISDNCEFILRNFGFTTHNCKIVSHNFEKKIPTLCLAVLCLYISQIYILSKYISQNWEKKVRIVRWVTIILSVFIYAMLETGFHRDNMEVVELKLNEIVFFWQSLEFGLGKQMKRFRIRPLQSEWVIVALRNGVGGRVLTHSSRMSTTSVRFS